jgi:hypothetical protein
MLTLPSLIPVERPKRTDFRRLRGFTSKAAFRGLCCVPKCRETLRGARQTRSRLELALRAFDAPNNPHTRCTVS